MSMAKLRGFLRFDIQVTVEEREGYFAAFTQPFAITTYGDTQQKAEERALRAVLLLAGRHSKTPGELSEYLNRFDIKHLLATKKVGTKKHHPVVRESKQEVQFRVPAGA